MSTPATPVDHQENPHTELLNALSAYVYPFHLRFLVLTLARNT